MKKKVCILILILLILSSCGGSSELYDFIKGKTWPVNLRQTAELFVIYISKTTLLLYWIPPLFILLLIIFSLFYSADKIKFPVFNSIGFIIFTILLLLLFRWPTLSMGEQNPDESQLIAGARTLLSYPVFWKSVDGTSIGPVCYYLLIIPKLFGFSIGYGTAKLMDILLTAYAIILHYLIFKSLFKDKTARFIIMPVLLTVSMFTSNDYISYNGECAAIFFITAAVYILFRILITEKIGIKSFLLGILLTVIFFTKAQVVPFCFIIGFAGYFVIYVKLKDKFKEMVKHFFFLSSGWLIILTLILILLLHFDIFNHFYQSYIINNLNPPTNYKIPFLTKVQRFPAFIFEQNDTKHFFTGMGLLAVAGIILLFINRKRVILTHLYVFILNLIFLLVSIICVIYPGENRHHYLLLLIFPLSFVTGSLTGILRTVFPGKKIKYSLYFIIVVLSLYPVIYKCITGYKIFTSRINRYRIDYSPVTEKILRYAVPGDKMVIWGWAPYYYVSSGLIQGTREAHTQRQILNSSQRPYYIERFVEDLKSSKAPVFLDAVSPEQFYFHNRQDEAHEAFESVNKIINKLYHIVGDINGVRIYVLKKNLFEGYENK